MKYLLFILFCSTSIYGAKYQYPYPDNPHQEIYKKRRLIVESKLKDYQVLMVFSSDFYTRSDYQTFRQNSDLLYLTGLPDSKAILIINPDGFDIEGELHKEILFMNIQNENDKIWNGVKITKRFSEDSLGISKVLDIDTYEAFISNHLIKNNLEVIIAPFTKGKHFNPILNGLAKSEKSEELEIEEIKLISKINPYALLKVDNEIFKSTRDIKDSNEIKLIQKAIDISVQSHINSIKSIKPDMYEYQIEAVMEGSFLSLGAENNGYSSVVGAGSNSCWLHYTSNRDVLKSDELILMDCGAEYHGYTADITRTVPVDGVFSNEQKLIYEIVLKAQQKAIDSCRAGIDFFYCDKIAKDVIAEGLLELKIIKNKNQVKKYFPHGCSHYLGLDVHDVGRFDVLRAGNVITLEPGIYIPEGSDCDKKWWNIGIRIEDDILVEEKTCKVLSSALPKTIIEIEKLMKKDNK
ncbi:aminopeptidase P family protein [Candidatus Kapabacteria bacterium]|nr:aminopeptidase P family protein [Candidatus Kapabacteria bacterium]